MNTHDAVAELVAKAQAAARKWYFVAAGVTVACIFASAVVLGVVAVMHALPGNAAGLMLGGVAVVEVAGIVAVTRSVVRRRLSALRTGWIDDVARREGLSSNELSNYFTLDSW